MLSVTSSSNPILPSEESVCVLEWGGEQKSQKSKPLRKKTEFSLDPRLHKRLEINFTEGELHAVNSRGMGPIKTQGFKELLGVVQHFQICMNKQRD